MVPYGIGRLGTVSQLHHKVVHGSDSTETEYLREDRKIKALSDIELALVCPSCFPLTVPMTWKSNRSAASYCITYPEIKRVVDAEKWNSELASK